MERIRGAGLLGSLLCHVVLAVKDFARSALAAVRPSSILDSCARRVARRAGNPAHSNLRSPSWTLPLVLFSVLTHMPSRMCYRLMLYASEHRPCSHARRT